MSNTHSISSLSDTEAGHGASTDIPELTGIPFIDRLVPEALASEDAANFRGIKPFRQQRMRAIVGAKHLDSSILGNMLAAEGIARCEREEAGIWVIVTAQDAGLPGQRRETYDKIKCQLGGLNYFNFIGGRLSSTTIGADPVKAIRRAEGVERRHLRVLPVEDFDLRPPSVISPVESICQRIEATAEEVSIEGVVFHDMLTITRRWLQVDPSAPALQKKMRKMHAATAIRYSMKRLRRMADRVLCPVWFCHDLPAKEDGRDCRNHHRTKFNGDHVRECTRFFNWIDTCLVIGYPHDSGLRYLRWSYPTNNEVEYSFIRPGVDGVSFREGSREESKHFFGKPQAAGPVVVSEEGASYFQNALDKRRVTREHERGLSASRADK